MIIEPAELKEYMQNEKHSKIHASRFGYRAAVISGQNSLANRRHRTKNGRLFEESHETLRVSHVRPYRQDGHEACERGTARHQRLGENSDLGLLPLSQFSITRAGGVEP